MGKKDIGPWHHDQHQEEQAMKKIQSGQGVTDLGSTEAREGADLMGRGEVDPGPLETSTSTPWGDPSHHRRPGKPQDVWFEGGTTPVGRDDHRDILITAEGLPPGTTVTFTGRAAEEYRRAKADGISDESAFLHAERVQKLIDSAAPLVDFSQRFEPGVYTEAGIQHDDPEVRTELLDGTTIVENQVTGAMSVEPSEHTCTYDDHGEDSDCLACNPRQSSFTMPEVDEVNHPAHYESLPGIDFECIVVTRGLTFDAGNAVKYVWRTDRKNGRQDLEKACWYVQDALDHADPIYSGPREEWYLTNELLQCVSLATKGHRSMFFEAIRLGYLEIALKAVNALIDRA
jgi:hypothetical protein